MLPRAFRSTVLENVCDEDKMKCGTFDLWLHGSICASSPAGIKDEGAVPLYTDSESIASMENIG